VNFRTKKLETLEEYVNEGGKTFSYGNVYRFLQKYMRIDIVSKTFSCWAMDCFFCSTPFPITRKGSSKKRYWCCNWSEKCCKSLQN